MIWSDKELCTDTSVICDDEQQQGYVRFQLFISFFLAQLVWSSSKFLHVPIHKITMFGVTMTHRQHHEDATQAWFTTIVTVTHHANNLNMKQRFSTMWPPFSHNSRSNHSECTNFIWSFGLFPQKYRKTYFQFTIFPSIHSTGMAQHPGFHVYIISSNAFVTSYMH